MQRLRAETERAEQDNGNCLASSIGRPSRRARARGVIGARYSSTVRARRPMPARKAAHAAGRSGERLSRVQSDICMDVYGVLDGQAHACAGAAWLCSVRNVGDISKINLARTRAHACMRGAKDRRQRDEPEPEASIGVYFRLGGSVPRRRSRPKHAPLDCAAVPGMVCCAAAPSDAGASTSRAGICLPRGAHAALSCPKVPSRRLHPGVLPTQDVDGARLGGWE
jgi:hypothetical protein